MLFDIEQTHIPGPIWEALWNEVSQSNDERFLLDHTFYEMMKHIGDLPKEILDAQGAGIRGSVRFAGVPHLCTTIFNPDEKALTIQYQRGYNTEQIEARLKVDDDLAFTVSGDLPLEDVPRLGELLDEWRKQLPEAEMRRLQEHLDDLQFEYQEG